MRAFLVKAYSGFVATSLSCALVTGSVHAALSADCKPSHFKPPFFLNSLGTCSFDPETLSFSGTPVEQAMCLMRGMDETRNLAPPLSGLPPALAGRIGETAGLPTREVLSSFLSKQNLEWDFAAYLWLPTSRAHNNDPDAPLASYFVIHDTSGPNFRHRAFPADIDTSAGFNNLANFACSDGWGKAHIVVNRSGDMLVDHDFAVPWRETKFEQAAEFGGALKGLFVHIELIQPRRAGARGGDARTPDPAFTRAQYDRLALLYVIASVRADHWLIPAFHAAIDAEIRDGHDDPLNFNVQSFADNLDALIKTLNAPLEPQVARAAAGDAQAADAAIPPDAPWIDAQWDHPPRLSAAPIQTAADAHDGQSLVDRVPDAAAAVAASPAPDAGAPPPPAHAIVALHERESEAPRQTAAAEHCQTHGVRGHRRRHCELDRAERRERGTRHIRTVDRDVSQQGDGARHYGRNLHARHARTTSRHDRT